MLWDYMNVKIFMTNNPIGLELDYKEQLTVGKLTDVALEQFGFKPQVATLRFNSRILDPALTLIQAGVMSGGSVELSLDIYMV